MRQKLSKQNLLLVGFTLFSMFFGAGNLIFPAFSWRPGRGADLEGHVGFSAQRGGTSCPGSGCGCFRAALASWRAGAPRLAFLFTLLIYLSIGPCLAIPQDLQYILRDDGVPGSEQMGVSLNSTVSGTGFTVQTMAQFGYSVVFFAGCHGSGIQAG